MSATPTLRSARPWQRTRWVGATCVVVLLAGSWVPAAWVLRRHVEVGWVGPVQCSGTTSSAESGMSEVSEDDPTSTLLVTPGMSCDLVVRVDNATWLPVRLDDVTLPFMGPAGGAPVGVEELEGRRARALDEDGFAPIDAVYDLSAWLAPRSERRLRIRLTFRETRCSSAGLSWVDVPEVDVRVLGLVGRRTAPETLGLRIEDPVACPG